MSPRGDMGVHLVNGTFPRAVPVDWMALGCIW